jgi:membrane-associated phospholipid phosphatase
MPQTRQQEIRGTRAEVTPVMTSSRIANFRHESAHVASTIIHPLLFPLVTIALVHYNYTRDIGKTGMLVLLTLLVTTLPVAALVWVQVQRGAWSDLDVSMRRQRYTLYPFALVCLGALMYIYYIQGAFYAVQCVAAFVIANVVNSIVNLAWKISAHATTAAACAALLWHFVPIWGPPAAISAIIVGWSRVELGRHTRGQVLAGWLVGVSSALIATIH